MLTLQTNSVFSAATTSGSIPAVVVKPEASAWENAKYEIGQSILNVRGRLLTTCDMHAPDLREVLLPPGQVRELTGSSLVMKESIAADMERLFAIIQRIVDRFRTEHRSKNNRSWIDKLEDDIHGIIVDYKRSIVLACYMHKDDLQRMVPSYVKFVDTNSGKNYDQVVGTVVGVIGIVDNHDGKRPIRVIGLDDGRLVMREILFNSFNKMSREIQGKLDNV
jgi:hypothetical protein